MSQSLTDKIVVADANDDSDADNDDDNDIATSVSHDKQVYTTTTVPIKLNLSCIQDAEAFNFRHPVMPRHKNLGVHNLKYFCSLDCYRPRDVPVEKVYKFKCYRLGVGIGL